MSNQQIEKSLQWYFHPSEMIRLLRYFQFNLKFDNNIDYTVHYNNDPTIGVVIGTYGDLSFVDLQLYFLKNINHIDNILIHDDCSPDKDQLKKLAEQYNVDFYSTPNKMWYQKDIGSIGELDCIYQGLLWAKSKNIDILVKIDSKLLPCFNWVENLKQSAILSEANTFSSYCTKELYNFRSECIGFNVNNWSTDYPLQGFSWGIENQCTVLTNIWIHELAKTISGNNYSNKWKEYCNNNKNGYLHSGYYIWTDILGTNKYTNENRHDNVLYKTYSKKEDYLNISKQIFGNKYNLEDFNK